MAEIGLNQKTIILTYREFQVKSNQIAQRKRVRHYIQCDRDRSLQTPILFFHVGLLKKPVILFQIAIII